VGNGPTGTDAVRAAVAQWTSDPCGADRVSISPGDPGYFEALRRERQLYASWMDQELDYGGAAGLRVLDVGCGQGIDLVRYAQAGADVVGVDITPRHLELARAHLADAGVEGTVVHAEARALPFADDTFDRVSSNGVLHHTPYLEEALREIRRVLKPGGTARIILYNKMSLHYWINQVLVEGVLKGRLLHEHSMEAILSSNVEISSSDTRPLVRVYSPRRTRRLLTEAGFVDVRTRVRHFQPEDTVVTWYLRNRIPALAGPRLDAVGRFAGWYVVGLGTRGR
jgi:ubiquinone/menaquinone biosynthesis C-methylase UbiE